MLSRLFALSLMGLVLTLWFVAEAPAAAPIQATAQAARTTVQVGEPVRITIQVRDSEAIPQIDAPKVRDMSISSTGTADVSPSALRNARVIPSRRLPATKLQDTLRDVSRQLNDISNTTPNGVDPQLAQKYQDMLKQRLGNFNRNDYSIVYLATPEKVGTISVPPFTVHANGQTVQTQPISLFVTQPRPSPWVKAALSLSKTEPSVGETVNLYVDLLVRRWVQQVGRDNTNLKSQPIGHVTLTVPPLAGYEEIQPVQPLENYVAERRLPPGQLGYHINHFPGVILLEQEPVGSSEKLDPQWYRRRLTIPFRAVQAGTMEVPPLRVAGEVYVPSTGKDRYAWEGFVASSSPLKFRILEAASLAVDPAPQRSSILRERTTLAVEPTAPADARSQPERGNEDNAMTWLPTLATLTAAAGVLLVTLPVAVALRRRLAGRRQHIARLSRKQEAVEEARQRLGTLPSTAAAISAALQDFLRAHLELAPGEITPEEAADRLSQDGNSTELAQTYAAVLRACAARQFAPSEPMEQRDIKTLALTGERLVNEILANKPKETLNPPAREDELTRERIAALAD